MNKITIFKSTDANTRSAKKVPTKDQLLDSTLSHIRDVNNVGFFMSNKLKENCINHDHTKIEYIDEFYNDFVQ